MVTPSASNAADVCPLSGVNRTPRVQRGTDGNDRAPRGRELSVREALTRIIVDWSGSWQAARPAELAMTLYQRDRLSSALICAGHSTGSHGLGPGCGCWRPRVLGSIRLCGDSLSRVASVACILVAFSHSAILSGSCAAPREISVA